MRKEWEKMERRLMLFSYKVWFFSFFFSCCNNFFSYNFVTILFHLKWLNMQIEMINRAWDLVICIWVLLSIFIAGSIYCRIILIEFWGCWRRRLKPNNNDVLREKLFISSMWNVFFLFFFFLIEQNSKNWLQYTHTRTHTNPNTIHTLQKHTHTHKLYSCEKIITYYANKSPKWYYAKMLRCNINKTNKNIPFFFQFSFKIDIFCRLFTKK